MVAKTKRPLRYHLRFQVIPGRNVERDARVLGRLCREHGVEEVVLFFAGEEWNNGLLSKAEEDVWFEAVARTKRVLDRAGVVCSLNPWMTTLHCARARRFPKGRPFRPTVGANGVASGACASFADRKWQRYLADLYGRFSELGFRVIWVEDDFRYHNHGAELGWGGGFEPEVIARFEKKIGRRTTREEVVANILKPGKPHAWRALWMETWRELQLETASGLAKAVGARAPNAASLGLMSSHPSRHSQEGRDWRKLFAALSIDGRVAHRPHYAPYNDAVGRAEAYGILMLDVQRNFRPADAEVAPEVENFPFTAWSKSDTQTWAEMALALFYGSDALLLDLFPFCGNRADLEPAVWGMLDRSRPGLEWIAARFTPDLKTCGVGLPWHEDACAHVRTALGKSMDEIDASSFPPGYFLLSAGVPVSAGPQPVNAVFGPLAWAFPDDELRRMLGGGLLLDGVSAEILCQRGFAKEIGLASAKIVGREENAYSVEETISPRCGVERGLYYSVNLQKQLAVLRPARGAEAWTHVITAEKKPVGAGLVAFRNALGGRVVTLAATDPAGLALFDSRQTIYQNAVRFLTGDAFAMPLVTGGPRLMPIHLKGPSGEWLLVFNASADAARPVITLPAAARRPQATLLAPLVAPRPLPLAIRDGNRIEAKAEVPALGFAAVQLVNGDDSTVKAASVDVKRLKRLPDLTAFRASLKVTKGTLTASLLEMRNEERC